MKKRRSIFLAWVLVVALVLGEGHICSGIASVGQAFRGVVVAAATSDGQGIEGNSSGDVAAGSGDGTTTETTEDKTSGSGNATTVSSGEGTVSADGKKFDKLVVNFPGEQILYKTILTAGSITVEGVDSSNDNKVMQMLPLSECAFTDTLVTVDSNFAPKRETVNNLEALTTRMGVHEVKAVYVSGDATFESETYTIKIVPDSVTNVVQTGATKAGITVSWDSVEGATGYRVRVWDETTGKWLSAKGGWKTNSIPAVTDATTSATFKNDGTTIAGTSTLNPLKSGGDYRICVEAFYAPYSLPITDDQLKTYSLKNYVVQGGQSTAVDVYTNPEAVSGLTCTETTDSSVSLSWDAVAGADGYLVFGRKSNVETYTQLANITDTKYTVDELSSVTTYYYKVKAYNQTTAYDSAYCDRIKVSTAPGKTSVTLKAGDGRTRITWSKVTSATGYQIWVKKTGEEEYTQVADIAQGTYKYVKTGLVNEVSYDVVVRAYRTINDETANVSTSGDKVYVGAKSELKSVIPVAVAATSRKAKNFKTKKAFLKSLACTTNPWFNKYVKYKKSFVMPGMLNTNVAGFAATRMCPQAVAVAKSYMLMTAYDYSGGENTVIYVMSKSSRKLLTTIVLPDKTHAGGMAFDGTNVWVSHGSQVAAIRFADIKAAAKAKSAYQEVEYVTLCDVKTTASYMTYYKGLLWVGKNAETGKQKLYSYTIGDKTGTPTLTAKDSIKVPDRTQGIAFLKDGTMVVSRSNLYDSTMNYYICQLDIYSPKWSGSTIKSLGKCINTCKQPTMNEGIAVSGKFLYVCYESPAFNSATVPMDRICAFNVASLKKKVAAKQK